MKSRFLLVISIVLLALLVGACGPAATPEEATSAPEPTEAPAAIDVPPTEEPMLPPEPVTISFWYALGGSNGEFLQALIDEYNETNEYAITIEGTYSGNYGETAGKVVASLESGELPSGGLIPAGPLWTCREGNYLIEDYINGEDGINTDDYWPVLWEYNTFDGHICSLPFNNSTLVMYYNKDLMTAAGLDPASPPTNWDELLEMGSAISASSPGVVGVDTSSPDWWLKALILQNGGEIMSADASTPIFNSAAGYGAMEFWKQMLDDGLMPVAEHGGARDLFIAGQVGFLMTSTGSVGRVRDGAQFEWGTAFLPGNETYGATVGGAALTMFPSDQAQEDATWRFFKWLVSPENSVRWTVATGYVPIQKAALEADEMVQLFADQPAYAAGFEQLEVSSTYPHFWEMGVMDGLFKDAIEQVEFELVTPQEALDNAAAALLAEMGN